jgi:hypothetical protein
MSNSNRRKHERIRASGIAAHLKTQLGLAFCVVENIAPGGLFLRTQQLLPLGTHVSLQLAQPGMKRALKLNARVVNLVEVSVALTLRMQPGMGLEFDKLRGEEQERLKELIRNLSQTVPPPTKANPGIRLRNDEPRSVARAIDQGSRPSELSTEALARKSEGPIVPPAPLILEDGFPQGAASNGDGSGSSQLVIQMKELNDSPSVAATSKRMKQLHEELDEAQREIEALRKEVREKDEILSRLGYRSPRRA